MLFIILNKNATVINSEIGQATAINPTIVTTERKLENGIILVDKY